jgi:hypothetical protein
MQIFEFGTEDIELQPGKFETLRMCQRIATAARKKIPAALAADRSQCAAGSVG